MPSRTETPVINNSWNGGGCVQLQRHRSGKTRNQDNAVSSKNIVAAIVIIVVIVGGGATLFKMNDGRGARASRDVTAKTASD
jgi:hypothetical protein